MSKEQLKELRDWKMNLNETLVLNGHEISEELKEETRKYRDLLDYAIEQAERVQELEEDNKNLQMLSSINRKEHMRIHEQNKRYREAIEYVTSAKTTHYVSLENALEDIKYVINEILESEK